VSQAAMAAGVVLEVNPVVNQIKDLRERSRTLRGYL
ncbi:hypothetical protein MNBD_GAMMA14-2635, partial [hydrothermal vent metagenome]